MSTSRNKEFPRCKKRDQRKWSVSLSPQSGSFLVALNCKMSNISSMFHVTLYLYVYWLILTFYPTALLSFHQLPVQKRKKQAGQRKRHFKAHNNHLAGVLEDYSDGVPVKKWQFSAARCDGWTICKYEMAGDAKRDPAGTQRLLPHRVKHVGLLLKGCLVCHHMGPVSSVAPLSVVQWRVKSCWALWICCWICFCRRQLKEVWAENTEGRWKALLFPHQNQGFE